MDTLQSMRVFARVAQRAGFAAAARELRMSPATVTKHVAALEARAGVRLLERTTRSVALTEAGRVYLERCLECLQAAEDADAAVSALSAEPRGVLRVSAPVDFAAQLAPVLGRFMLANPSVLPDLRLTNRVVHMVEEGVDVSIRVAPALDGSHVARPLARSRSVLCAAPAYLRRHGRPRRPEDLLRHRFLIFSEERTVDELAFEREGKVVRVKLPAAMTSNSGELLCRAVAEGAGIAPGPSFLFHADLLAGRVEPLLTDWSISPSFRIWALYPHRRFLPAKVRRFVDALREELGDGTTDPWWTEELASQRPRPRGRPAGSPAAGRARVR